MKVIIINKRRLGVTIIIVGLMLILLGFEKHFEDRLKLTALIQNNINSLVKYEALGKKLSYKLPEDWLTSQQKFSGNEILYHNDFSSKDNKIHGFVEVWNLNKDLKNFLDESKKISSEQNLYKSYNIKSININGKSGYLLKYIMLTSYDVEYVGYEYFLKCDNKFSRFSFFVKKDYFKESMPTIFENIVKTLYYKE